MNDQASQDLVIVFNASVYFKNVSKEELAMVRHFLPELLKEIIWQSDKED